MTSQTPVSQKAQPWASGQRPTLFFAWQPADPGVSTSDSPNPSQPPFVAPQQLPWTPRTPRSRFRPPDRSSMQCRMHSPPAHRLRSPPAHQLPLAPSHPPASQHHATKHPAALRSPMCEGVQGASLSPQHHTSSPPHMRNRQRPLNEPCIRTYVAMHSCEQSPPFAEQPLKLLPAPGVWGCPPASCRRLRL